ncbi:MAG: exosortase-associated EpsI family protein [Planctomycetaceae bacterium]|nr:exosortase-associated EpsI family protein [Planctomycetaceae bacterium]
MKAIIPVAVAIVLLLFCAAVNGYWTDRWGSGAATEIEEYGKRVLSLPLNFGDWEGTDSTETDESKAQLKAAHIDFAVQRTYRNVKNGQEVSVFLACGPQRHLAIHEPKSCFPAAGYNMVESELQFPIDVENPASGAPPIKTEFYTARFRKDEVTGPLYLRIFWSWNAGDGWVAPSWPKVAFAWEKVLYKLYVMGVVQERGDNLTNDPRVAFIHDLMPVLDKCLNVPGGPVDAAAAPAEAAAAEAAPAEAAPVPAG